LAFFDPHVAIYRTLASEHPALRQGWKTQILRRFGNRLGRAARPGAIDAGSSARNFRAKRVEPRPGIKQCRCKSYRVNPTKETVSDGHARTAPSPLRAVHFSDRPVLGPVRSGFFCPIAAFTAFSTYVPSSKTASYSVATSPRFSCALTEQSPLLIPAS
jgi:hypothetical protein